MAKRIKVGKTSKEGFLQKNFGQGIKYINDSRKFIYSAVIIFLAFALVGYFLPVPDVLSEKILKFVEELLSQTEGMSWSQLLGFIFFNNLQSSFFGMILGIFFGLFSIVALVANGYLIGFVSRIVSEKEGILVLWRLLPHGIFEIPAILISTGLGIKLGTFIFQKKGKETLKEIILKSLKAFFFVIVPLLIIAALIESSLIYLLG